jgi:hypothetical protein
MIVGQGESSSYQILSLGTSDDEAAILFTNYARTAQQTGLCHPGPRFACNHTDFIPKVYLRHRILASNALRVHHLEAPE